MKERAVSYKTEERLNAAVHGLGALLGCVGLFLLLDANSHKSVYATESILVYSFSVIILFSASTAYHLVMHPQGKILLRIVDHISIYLLIAGTYTPVALITLVDGHGWLIFYAVWGIALLGTVLKLFFTGRYEYISLILYLFMGWLIVFDIRNLIAHTTTLGLSLLALGGAFYTLGVFFYAIRRIPFNHLIWHFFVLGGAISHWLLMYLEIV